MGSHGLRYSFLVMENAQPLNPSLPKRLSAFLSSVERRDTLNTAVTGLALAFVATAENALIVQDHLEAAPGGRLSRRAAASLARRVIGATKT